MKRSGFLFLCLAFAAAMTACGSKAAVEITREQAVQEAARLITVDNVKAMADKIEQELDAETP